MSAPSPASPPDEPWGGYQALCWALGGIVVGAVAVFALVMSYRWRKRNATTEDFVTARGSVRMWRIGWSFFAGSVGSWVVSSTPSYAASAGLVGLFMYAFATGLPLFIIPFAGPLISRSLPHALSLSEFSGWRFGLVAQIGVTLVMILCMSIFMLSEFVTIGALYGVYVGPVGYPMIIVVGLLTLLYTAYGGLLVSIATDQLQGIASILLLFVITIYLGATFHQPLPPMNDVVSGNTVVGLSSILTMPASMFAATVFNEAMWQRGFAAESKAALWGGAAIGATLSILMVFICGLCGWLAAWADPVTVYAANPNLYMFYGLEGTINVATGTVNNVMGVVVLLMALVMHEGTVDSLQNGLLAAFSSFVMLGLRYYRRWRPGHLAADYQWPLSYTRVLVFLINIPLIVLGSIGAPAGWSIMDLFLIENMVACTICIPLLFGVSSRLRPYFGGFSFFLSWVAGFICPSLYGIFKDCWQSDLVYDANTFSWICVPNGTGAGSAGVGMAYAWYRNGYQWQYFLLALGCSTGAMVPCIAVNYLLERCGVRTFLLPGFRSFYYDVVADELDDGKPSATSSSSVFKEEVTVDVPPQESAEAHSESAQESSPRIFENFNHPSPASTPVQYPVY